MRLVSSYFIRQYPDKILNIHPSLLPAFKGTHAIKDAFDYGVKITGPTAFFVDELDSGAIILQEPVCIDPQDSSSPWKKKSIKPNTASILKRLTFLPGAN